MDNDRFKKTSFILAIRRMQRQAIRSISEGDQLGLPACQHETLLRLLHALESSCASGANFNAYSDWLGQIVETIERGPQT